MDAPPERVSNVVVALLGNGYAMVLVMTPVEELYAIPAPPESEVEPSLPLKVVKSAAVSLPVLAADAFGRLKIVC